MSSVALTQTDNSIIEEFHRLTNMTPGELRRWVASEESRNSGLRVYGDELVGPVFVRRIIELKAKKAWEYTLDDITLMNKVVGQISRQLRQTPHWGVRASLWRYCLMNWGHDPCKAD
jgi:hypothetical protein